MGAAARPLAGAAAESRKIKYLPRRRGESRMAAAVIRATTKNCL
jgi:hypothetical protein